MGCNSLTKEKVKLNQVLNQMIKKNQPFKKINTPDNIQGRMVNTWSKINGVFDYSQKYLYKGQWASNVPHGQGCLYRPGQQQIICGYFKQGSLLNEQCIKFTVQGTMYHGRLDQNGRMDGNGIFITQNFMYRGGFKQNMFDGSGIYKSQKQVKIGHFRKNKIIEGRIIKSQGIVQGQMSNEKVDGKGMYFWKDGGKYIGEFKQGKKHGKGILYNRQGKIVRIGKWVEDQFDSNQEFNNYKQKCIL